MGAWGRRRVTAGDPARGGGALGSPDLAKPGRPGVKSTRFWVWRTPRNMRDPLGGFPGLREARLGLAMARGGAERRCKSGSAADGRLGRAKGENNLRKLIGGLGWCSPRCRAGWTAE